MDTRNVAGGGDHAARAATDDHRLVCKFRPVALFNCRIKGIAIDVRN